MGIERIVGIDFGTSTSLIKVKTYKDGESMNDRVLADYIEFSNNSTVPSLVFETLDGQYYCGYEAEHAAVKGTLYRNFKLDLLSNDIAKREQAEKLTCMFLKHLYDRYDSQKTHFPKCDIETTYISYPAKWPRQTRDFMKKAATQAGFKNVEGLDEPSAAIHTVAVQESERFKQKGSPDRHTINILMIDMGAGTTDLAVCSYCLGSQNKVDILYTWPTDTEHSLFGGREIDEKLAGYVKQYLMNCGVTNLKSFEQKYMSQCKSWKENNVAKELNKRNEVKYCAFIDPMLEMLGVENEFPSLNRRNFEEMTYEYLKQWPQMVNDCITGAIKIGKLTSSEAIDFVILTGGHCQWYFVDEILTGEISYFGEVYLPKIRREKNTRVIRLVSPQETVAYGLVYQRLSASVTASTPDSVTASASASVSAYVSTHKAEQHSEIIVNKKGNTGGNIANKGLVARQGDWIYYNNFNDGRKLFKERINGNDKIKLCDDDCEYINVVGDWIYYSNASDSDRLYKIKTDGTGKVKLCNDRCWYINVVGDWIYYVEVYGFNSHGAIYKIRTDGSGKSIMTGGGYSYINVVGDSIFYNVQPASGNSLFSLYGMLNRSKIGKMNVKGSSQVNLRNDDGVLLNVEDNWIYYRSLKDNGNIYRITTDGVTIQKLINANCSFINVADGWIYYVNFDDKGKLYKARTDGSQRTMINDEACYWINIVGDWIYYSDHRDYGTLFKMRTDGTSKQRVSCY